MTVFSRSIHFRVPVFRASFPIPAKGSVFGSIKAFVRVWMVFWSVALGLWCGTGRLAAGPVAQIADVRPSEFVTNVAQFRTLSGADYLSGCDFRLTGVITLVDTNRDLLVLQDATGAVALSSRFRDQRLRVGQ